MTFDEWSSCANPDLMLQYLRKLRCVSDRKLRLVGVNCCRVIESCLSDERSRHAIEVAEQYADDRISVTALQLAHDKALDAFTEVYNRDPSDAVSLPYRAVAAAAYQDIQEFIAWVLEDSRFGKGSTRNEKRDRQAMLLVDVFGIPSFYPVSIDERWLTTNVIDLARTIYDERRFERLPILADALMDAGCGDATILEHCHSDLIHVRGCWLLDKLLGKE